MPTTDPQPPAGITTEYLAAGIRDGMAAQPDLVTAARPIADRAAVLIRHRLPDITATDIGAVMLHISACLADVLTMLTEEGETSAGAARTATSALAMAGIELYHSGEAPALDARAALVAQLQDFLAHFREDDDTELVEKLGADELTVGMLRTAVRMLRAAAVGLQRQPAAEQDAEPVCFCGRACCTECGKNATEPCACQKQPARREAPQ
jgi:hypothetical protein